MRTLTLCFLSFGALMAIGRSAENAPLLSVKFALPAQGGENGRLLHRELVYPNFKGLIPFHFSVVITNVSDKMQPVAQDWCSAGYDALTFEYTDESGKTRKAEKLGRDWPKNFYAWWALQPGESTVINVFYTDEMTWTGFPHPPAHKSETVTMRAVFDMKPFGRIVSEPLKILFTNNND